MEADRGGAMEYVQMVCSALIVTGKVVLSWSPIYKQSTNSGVQDVPLPPSPAGMILIVYEL